MGDAAGRKAAAGAFGRSGLGAAFQARGATPDIYPWLAAMDVFVLPSRWEGLPYSLLEAMALARPGVATRGGGVPEVVREGETGLLVPPGDAAALAEAMSALAADPARRAEMGRRGREAVARDFRRDAMIDAVSGLYRETVAASRRT